MAKKSKTQRAKASAARAAKKAAVEQKATTPVTADAVEEEPKKKLFKKSEGTAASAKPEKKAEAKPEKKTKKFAFLGEVRSELKRVTWPSRLDVIRWSGVVVVALVFFGLFVFVLDTWVVTPALLAVSSIGA